MLPPSMSRPSSLRDISRSWPSPIQRPRASRGRRRRWRGGRRRRARAPHGRGGGPACLPSWSRCRRSASLDAWAQRRRYGWRHSLRRQRADRLGFDRLSAGASFAAAENLRNPRLRRVDPNARLALLALDRDDAAGDLTLVDLVGDGKGFAARRARDTKRHPRSKRTRSQACAAFFADAACGPLQLGLNSSEMAWSEGRILERREWAPGLVTLRVAAEMAPFEPGQFVNVGLRLGRRARFPGPTRWRRRPAEPLEFYVTEVQGGVLTPALCAPARRDAARRAASAGLLHPALCPPTSRSCG